MSALDDIPPRLSADVVVRPAEQAGRHIIKNQRQRKYLQLGEQESFMLLQLDGSKTYGTIVESFESRFAEPLTCDELHSFVSMAKREGLIERSKESAEKRSKKESSARPPLLALAHRMYRSARKQSPLYFRVSLFNPDRVLNWLEPKTRWLFSRKLAVAAGIGGFLALLIVWGGRAELVSEFAKNLSWQTLILAWFTTIIITVCHEFGHGLACKKYGGEVHEMGALWLFFTPCLYCNVSDAWLLSSRKKRLLISMAGTYVDFLIWIVAVFVWRLTFRESAVNYMAWIIVTTCGLRVAFNINPLMRLDGYYALSDLLGIHNLRRRGRQRWMEYVRWALWGARWPAAVPEGRALLIYGACCWLFTVSFLSLLFFKLATLLQPFMGIAGVMGAAGMFVQLSKRYFKGSLGEDFMAMFRKRKRRIMIWALIILGILLIPIYDRAGGPFQVRPVVHWEVRAPIAGFLREVQVDEGDQINAGSMLARIEVPQLTSEIARKEAEIHEVEAELHRLEAGTRPEILQEQGERIKRAIQWRDLAKHDLEQASKKLREELAQLDLRITNARNELSYRNTMYQQAEQLYKKGGLAGQQLLSIKRRNMQAESELQEAQAAKRAREAEGTLTYEGELARRQKELADTRAALVLFEAGSRPEEIEAARARLCRLEEELSHLRVKQQTSVVSCPVSGTVMTPRLKEKIGQYFEPGAIICIVEDLVNLEAEIAVSEQDSRVLVPGQPVTLRPRALPFRSLKGKVDRVATAALGKEPAAGQSTVTVYCRVENEERLLRTGMTGYGRIEHRLRPLGWIMMTRGLRFLRTEFWL